MPVFKSKMTSRPSMSVTIRSAVPAYSKSSLINNTSMNSSCILIPYAAIPATYASMSACNPGKIAGFNPRSICSVIACSAVPRLARLYAPAASTQSFAILFMRVRSSIAVDACASRSGRCTNPVIAMRTFQSASDAVSSSVFATVVTLVYPRDLPSGCWIRYRPQRSFGASS